MAERKQRIGWRRGPTEDETERADLVGTETVVEPYDFDTPPVAEVLQAEVGPDNAVPVRLTNAVNVNQLPTRVGTLASKLIAASPATAVRLLNADPRRAAVTFVATAVEVAIGRTQAEANDDNAFRLLSQQGPYRFHFTEEVWVRSIAGSVRLSYCVENWAR